MTLPTTAIEPVSLGKPPDQEAPDVTVEEDPEVPESVEEATPSELDAFDPPPQTVTLSTGAVVRILDLKTRQFFRLLRIVTRGAGGFLMQSELSLNDTVDGFVAKLMGVLIVAVPEAEDETLAFLSSMIEPDGLIERADLDKRSQAAAAERNAELWAQVNEALANPELEDTLDLLDAIFRREAKDIMNLGKRLQRMFALAQRTGQLKSEPAPSPRGPSAGSTPTGLSAGSAMPST